MSTVKVYIGADNPARATFYRSGAPFDYSGVDSMLITFRESDVVVDSALTPDLVDYAVGGGNIDFRFGDLNILPGTYSAKIIIRAAAEDQILVDYDDDFQFRFVQNTSLELIVQDDDGTEIDAMSYIDIAYFKAYHNRRGGDYSNYDDHEIKIAIVKAFDYVETRFEYVSSRLTDEQNSEWPRYGYATIPRAIKEAQAEYALRALSFDINPDPDNISNGRLITSKSEGIGSLSESFTYDANAGSFALPDYPTADRKIQMAKLVNSSNVTFLSRG